MKKYIDARNLPNPQPLVYTKRALADGEFSYLIVHVNNATARENVIRFARHAGFPVEKTEEREGEFFITIANTEELSSTVDPKPQESGTASPEKHWAKETARPRPSRENAGSERQTPEPSTSTNDRSDSPAFAAPSVAENSEEASADSLSLRQHNETVKTLLIGAGRSVFRDEHRNLVISPFLQRFLRALPKIYGDLQQIILTDGAALLGSSQSDYLPLLKTLRRQGVQIYCDQESCEEWEAAPSPEVVTLIDAESLTQKLLRYAPVLTL